MLLQRQVFLRSSVYLTRRLLSTAGGAAAGSSSTTTSSSSTTVSTPASSSTTSQQKKDDEEKRLRIVVAVGGNALQRRGDRLTIENMLKAAAAMAPTMATLAQKHELGKSMNNENV